MSKNLQIKIAITDGEKEVKAAFSMDDYKTIKKLHEVNILDDLVDTLLQEISKGTTHSLNKDYQQIKSECELPVGLLTYTYKDFEGVLHPFASIAIDFRDSDEINIQKMEKVKSKYGEFFMFFNNSTEGKEFWKNNPITITPKK
jgi:hypothetical protein